MNRNVENRMRKYLTFTMLLTSMFVVATMLLSIGGSALNLLQSNQLAVVRGLQSLYEKTDLPIDELIGSYPLINHSVSVMPEEEAARLPAHTRETLASGRIVYSQLESTSLVMIGGRVIRITAQPLRLQLIRTMMWAMLSLLVFFLGGVALATVGSRRFSRSIVRLTRATRAVAGGDFGAQVKEDLSEPVEIQVLNHNFNLMVRELNRNATLKNDFISAVSHEFKTPLAAIRGYAKYAMDPTLTEEQRNDCLRVVLEETDQLTAMSANILKLSKLDNQEIPEKRVVFQLDEQLRQCVLALEPGWSEKELELNIDLDEVSYEGDDDLLRQVWINLLQNAIKFSEKGGQLGVRLKDGREGVAVEISDTGIGMSEEVVSHIFERFYQGDRAHHSQGNGLGLSLVQQILKLTGGKITVRSAPGEGSVFTVILPREGERRPVKRAANQEAIPARTGRRKRGD